LTVTAGLRRLGPLLLTAALGAAGGALFAWLGLPAAWLRRVDDGRGRGGARRAAGGPAGTRAQRRFGAARRLDGDERHP
jgi:hypothetical protein